MTLRTSTHLLFITAILTLVSSCQKHPPSSSEAEASEITTASPTLSLDDGKKWQVDDHTRQSIQRLSKLVDQSPPEKLAQAMASEINSLFEGCTMTGSAHDQLHIILADMLSHVNGLYSSTTPAEHSAELKDIKKILQAYDTHFE